MSLNWIISDPPASIASNHDYQIVNFSRGHEISSMGGAQSDLLPGNPDSTGQPYAKLSASDGESDIIPAVLRSYLPYCAIWSRFAARGPVPCPRTNNCYAYDRSRDEIFIAYGRDRVGNLLNDAWILNLREHQWRCASRQMLGARHSSSAVLFGDVIVIFGGQGKRGYLGELHTFDLGRRKLSHAVPGGPAPRARPVLFSTASAVVICGGHSNKAKSDMHAFHFRAMRWEECADPEIAPRFGTAWCSDGDGGQFLFGGGIALARFDPDSGQITAVRTTGSGPDQNLAGLSMAAGRNFLYVFGGQHGCELWALNLRSLAWAPLFVAPDNRSVSSAEGRVTEAGALELPRSVGETMAFSPVDASLFRVLGADFAGRCPVQRLSMGRALAALNHAADMTAMLRSA